MPKRQFTVQVSPVSRALELMEARKNFPPSRYDLSLANFLLQRALQQKLYRQDFRDVDHLKRVLYTAGSDKSDAMEEVPRRLPKRVAMVYRVHSRQAELLLTY